MHEKDLVNQVLFVWQDNFGKSIDNNEEVCYTYDEKGISYLNEKAINGLNLYAYCENNPVM
jgi:hypothetical protein